METMGKNRKSIEMDTNERFSILLINILYCKNSKTIVLLNEYNTIINNYY